MIENINHYIRIHKELHGDDIKAEEITKDVVTSFDVNYDETLEKVKIALENKSYDETKKPKKKFGLFIGRCQPFHKGHQEIINEILLEGLTPIIVLGSSNDDRDRFKNPLTYAQRKELIRLIYPNIPIIFIRGVDYSDWDMWFSNLTNDIGDTLHKEIDYNGDIVNDIVLFSHNKEVDRTSFTFNNKKYKNTFYTDIFRDRGIVLKQVQFVKRTDVKINANARDIRENIEGMKHLLDARVYFKLKEWLW